MGISFVKGEKQYKTLLPNQYWGLGTTLQAGDTLNFKIESNPVGINIYIMNDAQMESYRNNPQDEADYYIKEWWHYSLITDCFVASYDQQYWILMINPSDSINTDVVIDASIDEYIPKTITITNPTSVDKFSSGNVYITWTSTGSFDYVRIELYKNGVFLKTISSTTYNDGSYDWYIYIYDDYTDSSYYQIKITDYYDDSIYDYSNYFSIEIESEEPDPYKQSQLFLISLFWIILILTGIGLFVAGILVRKHKRKSPKEVIIIQEKEVPKITYCHECGTVISDKTKIFCSNCGSKIIS